MPPNVPPNLQGYPFASLFHARALRRLSGWLAPVGCSPRAAHLDPSPLSNFAALRTKVTVRSWA